MRGAQTKAPLMRSRQESPLHYVLVCHGKNCRLKGAPGLLDQLRTSLAPHPEFKVIPSICFGACAASPNVVAFPRGLWYSRLTPDRVVDVAAALVRGDEIAELSGKVSRDVMEMVGSLLGRDQVKF
jgi:NADH-quinone oxidoreductase subunit F